MRPCVLHPQLMAPCDHMADGAAIPKRQDPPKRLSNVADLLDVASCLLERRAPSSYSIFTSAARITGAHLASSSLMNFAVRSGVVSVVGTAAISSRNLTTLGSAMSLREAWSIVSITGCGVPGGQTMRLNV